MKTSILRLGVILATCSLALGAEAAASPKPPLPPEILDTLTSSDEALAWPYLPLKKDGLSPALSAALAAVSADSYDLTALVEHIRRHPDGRSAFALMALRAGAPAAYASLPGGTKAAILADMLGANQGDFLQLDLSAYERHSGPDYRAEAKMKLTEEARALLELAPPDILPLLRDRLIDCRPMLIAQHGILTTKGNYTWWLARRLQGNKATLGRFEERWRLFLELPALLDLRKGAPVPADLIDAMVKEASDGVLFRQSNHMWRLYAGQFDYLPLAKRLAQTPDYRSYCLLMALRSRDLARYWKVDPALRAAILVSALDQARNLHEWTVLVTDASGALLPPAVAGGTGGLPVTPQKPPYIGDNTVPDVILPGSGAPVALAECGKPALKPIADLRSKLAGQPDSQAGFTERLITINLLSQIQRAIEAGQFGCSSL